MVLGGITLPHNKNPEPMRPEQHRLPGCDRNAHAEAQRPLRCFAKPGQRRETLDSRHTLGIPVGEAEVAYLTASMLLLLLGRRANKTARIAPNDKRSRAHQGHPGPVAGEPTPSCLRANVAGATTISTLSR